jgi:hypothetical protein
LWIRWWWELRALMRRSLVSWRAVAINKMSFFFALLVFWDFIFVDYLMRQIFFFYGTIFISDILFFNAYFTIKYTDKTFIYFSK